MGGRAVNLAGLDAKHVWHPYATVPPAVPTHVVESAEGVRLRLADGREVIDGMSSWWAAIHGYRVPEIDAAITGQLGRMAHVMFGGLTHEPAILLAERLAAMTGYEKVFLADSGSVAVEVAIKMAVQATGKRRLLTVRGGYHGDTFGCMSVCDPVNGMHHVFSGAVAEQVFAPVPPLGYDAPVDPAYLDEVDRLAGDPAVGAMILEPVVQGAGGMRFYNPAYLRAFREICDRHGLLLIADEIATGFGRSGALFGCDHAGIRADIVTVGKALTGGYLTMAATLTTPEIAERIGLLMHGPTYMGNPLAAAAAGASLDLLAARPWRAEVALIEETLRKGLAPAQASVADVRVLGAIGVVECHRPVDMKKAQDAALDHGVWLRPFGKLVYAMPPYACTQAEVATIAAAMVAAATA
ncbi:adenosylmethionine--8-amino-7-oxononanoate transaminase [Herbidospora sp. NBRC 101105]|uniref:adenosylmethionine--8-amino-7-oxononanoate transaminase n=1 Tax=Herbidospora sp. NBRC 101105 TaxID=3032195 RepID=UPI002555F9F5|nr:adenosylmethionine--8-amino-7-oxononanoate transaminase [Herbidospora sp. NBRC 101105]